MALARRTWAALGGAAFALGALTPWAWPTGTDPTAAQTSAIAAMRPRLGSDLGAAAATPERLEGMIAIGDASLREARSCLRDRGVTIYPDVVTNVDDLLLSLQAAVTDHAAVLIHTGAESGLVDGDIVRAIGLIGTTRRVIWATMQIPDRPDGVFSFEERTNASIRNVVGRYPEGRVLDWNAATARHADWTLDGIHMSPLGCREYAAKAVKLSGLPRRT